MRIEMEKRWNTDENERIDWVGSDMSSGIAPIHCETFQCGVARYLALMNLNVVCLQLF